MNRDREQEIEGTRELYRKAQQRKAHPEEYERTTLDDLYTQLDAAIEAVTTLSITAQQVLPTGLVKVPEAALARLLQLREQVNPGPTESDPF
jgi:hypothetical protein